MESFYRLKDFFKDNKWSYLFGLFWLFLVDSVQLLVARILGNLTNDLQNNILNMEGIIKYSLYIIINVLIIGFGRYFGWFYLFSNSRELVYYSDQKCLDHRL